MLTVFFISEVQYKEVAAVKILAFDTSGKTVTAALAGEDTILCEASVNNAQNHSVTLMPMIKQLLDSVNMPASELTHIACASGPGSFTGLRIGAATAKALAYAMDIPIIAVPTLDSLAYNVFDSYSIIVPIMDARQRQVYTAYYQRNPTNGDLIRLSDYMAKDISDVLKELIEFNKSIIFLGDGTPVYKDAIKNNNLGIKFIFAPLPALLQRAASVACLALKLAREGKTTDSKSFTPFYLRKSQAERGRDRE